MPEMKLLPDQATVDFDTKLITFKALPYPMPPVWQQEYRDAAKLHPGDVAYLTALEIRARESIGVWHTRPVIMPRVGV